MILSDDCGENVLLDAPRLSGEPLAIRNPGLPSTGGIDNLFFLFPMGSSPGPRGAVLAAVGREAGCPSEPRGHPPGRGRGQHGRHQLHRGLENPREYRPGESFQRGASVHMVDDTGLLITKLSKGNWDQQCTGQSLSRAPSQAARP